MGRKDVAISEVIDAGAKALQNLKIPYSRDRSWDYCFEAFAKLSSGIMNYRDHVIAQTGVVTCYPG
jgi:hypothetical protein